MSHLSFIRCQPMLSEGLGRGVKETGSLPKAGHWVILVLPVDADRATCQHLALWTSRVLSFYCLTTHSPVAALGTAGTLVQHSTDKDLAVEKQSSPACLVQGEANWVEEAVLHASFLKMKEKLNSLFCEDLQSEGEDSMATAHDLQWGIAKVGNVSLRDGVQARKLTGHWDQQFAGSDDDIPTAPRGLLGNFQKSENRSQKLQSGEGGHGIPCHAREAVPLPIHMIVTKRGTLRLIKLVVSVPPGLIQTDSLNVEPRILYHTYCVLNCWYVFLKRESFTKNSPVGSLQSCSQAAPTLEASLGGLRAGRHSRVPVGTRRGCLCAPGGHLAAAKRREQ
ncbi:hypothetical protein MC885_009025, partial [Smutsia gigantea]